mmetsp:Transcript_52704/g.153626  ORF Transcript_52704/g.153626 Transcript_52704/m.153626 type:complete len:274 (+) Transcript_52704:349-1170(+)
MARRCGMAQVAGRLGLAWQRCHPKRDRPLALPEVVDGADLQVVFRAGLQTLDERLAGTSEPQGRCELGAIRWRRHRGEDSPLFLRGISALLGSRVGPTAHGNVPVHRTHGADPHDLHESDRGSIVVWQPVLDAEGVAVRRHQLQGRALLGQGGRGAQAVQRDRPIAAAFHISGPYGHRAVRAAKELLECVMEWLGSEGRCRNDTILLGLELGDQGTFGLVHEGSHGRCNARVPHRLLHLVLRTSPISVGVDDALYTSMNLLVGLFQHGAESMR